LVWNLVRAVRRSNVLCCLPGSTHTLQSLLPSLSSTFKFRYNAPAPGARSVYGLLRAITGQKRLTNVVNRALARILPGRPAPPAACFARNDKITTLLRVTLRVAQSPFSDPTRLISHFKVSEASSKISDLCCLVGLVDA
jgi:hypothetical protein